MSETQELTGVLKTIYEHIEATNAAFREMTVEQKRVQVAKDVLLQLELRRMEPFSVYFSAAELDRKITRLFWDMAMNRPVEDGELRDEFKKLDTCAVCGVGAIFVALVEREDKLKLSDALRNGGVRSRKLQWTYVSRQLGVFTEKHLDEIEHAFETHPGFCPAYEPPRLRMSRVMNRIIELEGNLEGTPFPEMYSHDRVLEAL